MTAEIVIFLYIGSGVIQLFRLVLKELRDIHNDTQSTLAEKLAVSKTTISNWEQGKCEPDFRQLCEICNLYDVSADYLLGRRIDDRSLRMRRFDALTEDNQRFIIKLENLLLLDQQRQTKK